MTVRVLTVDAKTGEETVTEYSDAEAIELGLFPAPAEIEAAQEARAQEIADKLLSEGRDENRAIAMATVDLVMAAAAGQVQGKTKTQVRKLFKDRVLKYMRDGK